MYRWQQTAEWVALRNRVRYQYATQMELRLWRGRRDARLLRPAATRDRVSWPLEIQRKQLRVLIGGCVCLFALALWAILTLRPLTNPNFRGLASQAQSMCVRHFTVTFASTLLTGAGAYSGRKLAGCSRIYTRVSTIPIEQRNHLAGCVTDDYPATQRSNLQ